MRGYSKYRAKKTVVDGITFDSAKEALRYSELRVMEKAGLISNLERQVKYELIPPYVANKKTVFRACNYVADFRYVENGETIVEDVKGLKTDAYKIKAKLMAWIYGIVIRET